ncbi:pyridoxamine 5'-phosphate oxidase [Pseudohongiella spirulinae]|uniref:Pyridoxine/pyridoxamine 5'-phosphate oxidase n=1 Tax=Pseudohongiella spirulinae TaxID=1249552 RepID=A0A0S2KAQ6_9GAMM|nr:pyridoxamine 5'-phosphate oxidase [Pseudohongiella spirulinae]ALO45221.1 pyridoxine 5'-phosphate oxidase [Pseudohongiella spirulinae]
MDLQSIRREYLRGQLHREELALDPIEQFGRWMDQAIKMEQPEPTAMVLATSQPSQRVVLLKGFDERGFTFFTNYESRKAQQIAVNSSVSLHFPWLTIERQVIIQGVAEKVSIEESRAYFNSRPRESQLGAWASPQSRVLASRDVMEQQYESASEKFAGQDIPLPEFWGGYRVAPQSIEFWQGGSRRLHDRFLYIRQADGDWLIERLAP